MVKITHDLISRCAQYLNAVREFQLDLRSYKITTIENLSSTNNQFSCIDLSDNSITKIPQLPKLTNLRTLLLINNRITVIDPSYAECCPHLENLILTNNKINDIEQLENIAKCTSLIRVSLVDNLITKLSCYRLYLIYLIPTLRVLDFQMVSNSERIQARELFGSDKGKEMIMRIKEKKFHQEEDNEFIRAVEEIRHNDKIKQAISNMIMKISDFEEFMQVENKIKTGEIYDEINQNEENSNNDENE
jgi:U2 small nuclear ribonucleoprotein A'